MRFSRPRAPIFFRTVLARLDEDFRLNPNRYRHIGNYLLYAGLIAVLFLSGYVLIFNGR